MFSPTVIRHRVHDDGFAVVITDGHGKAAFQVYDTSFHPVANTYIVVDHRFTEFADGLYPEDQAIVAFEAPMPEGGYVIG